MSRSNVVQLAVGGLFHGHYQVVRRIKAGGMGAVYEVLDLKTQRRRALKVMHPDLVDDADLRKRFGQEATITADVVSEHIVETFDADVDPETGAPYLVMELLRGEDLEALLKRRKRLPPEEVVFLLHQAALALDKMHAAGVVHRDLKPENLFRTERDDGTPRLKILDFGIAKVVAKSKEAAATTLAVGTPLYMPPEQIEGVGDIGPRADLYALGQIAYTLLVGEAYWSAESRAMKGSYALIRKVIAGATQPASERASGAGIVLRPGFDSWFEKATAPQPEDRFDSAPGLVTALAGELGLALPRASLASMVAVAEPKGSGQSAATTTERLTPAMTQKLAAPSPGGPSSATERMPTSAALPSGSVPGARKRSGMPLVLGIVGLVTVVLVLVVVLRRSADAEPEARPAPMSNGLPEMQPAEGTTSAVQAAASSSAPIATLPATEPAPPRAAATPTRPVQGVVKQAARQARSVSTGVSEPGSAIANTTPRPPTEMRASVPTEVAPTKPTAPSEGSLDVWNPTRKKP